MVFSQHTCGKCEDIIDDFIEMGVKMWNSAQICNDLEHILVKYKGKLIVEGGWDSSGPASYIGADESVIVEETKRCALQYAQKGNFILFPTLLNEKGNALLVGDSRFPALLNTWHKFNRLR